MHTERLGFGGISIRGSLRLAARLVKEQRALGRAAKQMPRPMPWDWASPRLLPLLCGPYLADDELMTDVLDPGCAVVFGVDLGRVFTLVDPEVAEPTTKRRTPNGHHDVSRVCFMMCRRAPR